MSKLVKIIEYAWSRDYGVHEIEGEPYQGSGIFRGRYDECIGFIIKNNLKIDWESSEFLDQIIKQE